MTYRQGEIIVASDYNSFRTTLLNVYDVGNGDAGYGQIDKGGQPAIPTVAVNDLVQSAEWDRFVDAAQDCSDHQGSSTTFPPASEVAVGEIVEAHEADDGNAYDINGSLSTITSNRLTFDAGSMTIFTNELNSIRNTAWQNQLVHQFRVTFPTVDDARYFFNSGGSIRMRGSRSGGSSTPQNTDWTNLLAAMGSINLRANDTATTGSYTVASTGYYDLSGSFQQIAQGVSSGAYAVNDVTVYARTVDGPGGVNADNGRILEFRVEYNDDHTSVWFDNVDGTITSDVDFRKATSPLVINDPSAFTTIIPLTAGS